MDQAGAIAGSDEHRREVALLAHGGPVDVDQALAVALAIALDIFAVGPVNDRALAPADKADDLIAWQRATAVGQPGQQAADTRHLELGRARTTGDHGQGALFL